MVTATELLGALNTDAAEVLDVLAAASMVLNNANEVVRATPGAVSFGLVQNSALVHKPLIQLVDSARKADGAVVADLTLQTGLRGQRSYVHARAAKLGNNNVLLMVEDRTESRRLDDTRRDFIANVSHELKTPIGAIALLSEAIQDADPETTKRFAASLQRETMRLATLVQDIIELSEVQSAESQTSFQLLDMAEIVSDAADINQVQAENKRIRLSVSAPAGHMVFGDRKSLTTAVKNLIENAILYSEPGGQVGVGLREVDSVVELTVLDNGIGIAVADQERIFERFYRVDPSRSRETGGTGLGLAIVKNVAKNHFGEVTVFSQPGLGSTFTLRLPVADTSSIDIEGNNE